MGMNTNNLGLSSTSTRPLCAGNQHENWERMMQIGKPLRTIVVEPLELPVEQPTREPEPEPIQSPEPKPEPQQVPAKQ